MDFVAREFSGWSNKVDSRLTPDHRGTLLRGITAYTVPDTRQPHPPAARLDAVAAVIADVEAALRWTTPLPPAN